MLPYGVFQARLSSVLVIVRCVLFGGVCVHTFSACLLAGRHLMFVVDQTSLTLSLWEFGLVAPLKTAISNQKK